MGWATLKTKKMKVVTYYLTKPQYRYKQICYYLVLRRPWSPNADHFGFNDSVQGLGLCLRPSMLKTNHFGIYRYSQVSPKRSI